MNLELGSITSQFFSALSSVLEIAHAASVSQMKETTQLTISRNL